MMGKVQQEQSNNCLPPVTNSDAVISHFQECLASGTHWYIALLEAIGQWTDEQEQFEGHKYQYLVEGEAFDWMLLAERLCDTADGLIPESEKYAFLFQNKPPMELTPNQFKELIGPIKYRQFLNYFYGITVEEALKQAVREEVRKERRANGLSYQRGKEDEEAFERVYGDTESALLKQFRREKRRHLLAGSNLTEIKQFTYWCFKYRVKTCEKAKVASDTHKGLQWLQRNGIRC
jgi:hypothetical protein